MADRKHTALPTYKLMYISVKPMLYVHIVSCPDFSIPSKNFYLKERRKEVKKERKKENLPAAAHPGSPISKETLKDAFSNLLSCHYALVSTIRMTLG